MYDNFNHKNFDVSKVRKVLRLQKIRHLSNVRQGKSDPITEGEINYLEEKINKYQDWKAARAKKPFAARYACCPSPFRKVTVRTGR